MVYILVTILMFGFLIAIHEFGHFATAKFFGVKVNEFAIGMGPALWKKQGEETLYSLRILPVGGYCAMEGEDADSQDPRAFGALAAWKQMIVLGAGAFMNFVVGLLLCLGLMIPTQSMVTTQLAGVEETFPYQGEEGLMAGDIITSVDGNAIYLYSDITMYFSRSNGETMDLVINRDGKKIVLDDFPLTFREYENEDGTTSLRYGINFLVKAPTLGDKLANGWYTAINFVRLVFISLQDLISGAAGMEDLTGPVGIVSVVSEVGSSATSTAIGIYNMLYFAALIAVNLAVMNLLPLPALDGGRIFFLALNSITWALFHKKIPVSCEGYVHLVGLFLLMGLMLFVTVGDISRLIFG